MSHRWYAIQAYSGSEASVKKAIVNLVKEVGIEEKLLDIVVPMEDVIEVKKGKQKVIERPLYPGYVFANLDLDTALWQMIQSLSRVGKFIGEAKKPTPLSDQDINLILEKAQNKSAPKPKVSFHTAEVVRIIDGPFANFTGSVEEYDLAHGKLRLNVSIFGRSTPVEILCSQVEKIV
jgi:transcription termination/antitermination protein NusG